MIIFRPLFPKPPAGTGDQMGSDRQKVMTTPRA